MHSQLSQEETEFLLDGWDFQTSSCERMLKKRNDISTLLSMMESLLDIFPRNAAGFVFMLFCISLFPIMGMRLFQLWFGDTAAIITQIITSLAGLLIIYRFGRGWLGESISAIQSREVPSHMTIYKAVATASGILLMMPGPIVNILAIIMLFPPVTRLITVSLSRRLKGVLE